MMIVPIVMQTFALHTENYVWSHSTNDSISNVLLVNSVTEFRIVQSPINPKLPFIPASLAEVKIFLIWVLAGRTSY